MTRYRRIVHLIAALILAVSLSACGRASVKNNLYPVTQTRPDSNNTGMRQDVYHSIGPGETIWRIAKIYDVNADDIMKANRINDPSKLEMGTRLIIPRAASIRPVVTLYNSTKWKFIIIHHSATDEGNALNIYKAHRDRGWDTIGYHFVIDNGSDDRQDGQIETGPRWTKQMDGAHCKAGSMNSRGIGICLVGNFNIENVSQKQLDSLVYLVNTLSRNYGIPAVNIMGHGMVTGAKTDCPGKKFPWREFNSRIGRGF